MMLKEFIDSKLNELAIFQDDNSIHISWDSINATEHELIVINSIENEGLFLKYQSEDEMLFSEHYDLLWEKYGQRHSELHLGEIPPYKWSYSIDDYINIKKYCKNDFLSAKEFFAFQFIKSYKSTKFSKVHFDELIILINEDFKNYYSINNQNLIDQYIEKWFQKDINYFSRFLAEHKRKFKFHYNPNNYYGISPEEAIYRRLLQFEIKVKRRKLFDSQTNCYYKYIETSEFLSEFLTIICSDLLREYENKLREKLEVPKIGEGWVSETTLYNSIKSAFPNTDVIHQGCPEWLGKQRFDIYLPEYNIAIEYQGIQHIKPVARFGGEEGFKGVLERDERKRNLCLKHQCDLIYVYENYNISDIINEIQNVINRHIK